MRGAVPAHAQLPRARGRSLARLPRPCDRVRCCQGLLAPLSASQPAWLAQAVADLAMARARSSRPLN